MGQHYDGVKLFVDQQFFKFIEGVLLKTISVEERLFLLWLDYRGLVICQLFFCFDILKLQLFFSFDWLFLSDMNNIPVPGEFSKERLVDRRSG